jgi:hypothetical protein
MIPLFNRRIMEAERLWTSSTLLRLVCRCCLRSVRNAQVMGNADKNFAERFVAVLEAYNGIEFQAYSEAKAFAAGEIESMSYETTSQTLLPFEGDAEFEVNAAANEAALKMARLIEILYLVSKNRKNKSQLLEKGILQVLVKIYNNHFDRRFSEIINLEVAALIVASFRQFCKLKKGKETLMGLNGLSLCESSIRHLSDERRKLQSTKHVALAPIIQLQDSLCALTIRCLPPSVFPMSSKTPFPLSYPLPIDKKAIANTAATNRQQANTSLLNRTLRNSLTKSPLKTPAKSKSRNKSVDSAAAAAAVDSALDDDGSPSSDEDFGDEEDESLKFFNSTLSQHSLMGGIDDIAMLTPASEEENDSDNAFTKDGNSNRRILRSDTDNASKDGDLGKYSSLKVSELNANYRSFFTEYESGACSPEMSPKQRRMTIAEPKHLDFIELITEQSQKTLSVGDFVKIPYPDLCEMDIDLEQQDLISNPESMREAMIQEMARFRLENQFPPQIVFDLDKLLLESSAKKSPSSTKPLLSNSDLEIIGKSNSQSEHLLFESRFESGNLRRATRIAENHYELIISPDINQRNAHYQWFYFQVSNNKSNIPYTFEIINCLKTTSMFSQGMQPVLFSVTEAQKGRPGWVRAGSSVCYYRNLYVPRSDSSAADDSDPIVVDKPKKKGKKISATDANNNDMRETKSYFSTRFTIKFRHNADVCYIAYHYPYTFTFLQATLEKLLTHCDPHIFIRKDQIATTIRGNPIPLITITAPGSSKEIENREIVIFSARVHPGESNASWIMHGLLKFLTSTSRDATKLREHFVFKIIPMLNPDGVINGSHRCGLAGVDLNRVWDFPNQLLHPSIYHSKGLIQYIVDVLHKKPFVFVDLHGHSKRSNVFMFGNNPEESWRNSDHLYPHNNQYNILPEYLAQISNGFSMKECRFNIAKSKESSARVTLWRQFNIERSYTMESTYCGFDMGPYAGKQIGITEHNEMGRRLAEALLHLQNYNEGISHLPRATAKNVNEIPPPPVPPSSPPNRSTSNSSRRKSVGSASNLSGTRMNLRRSNTMKSAASIASAAPSSK